MLDSVSQEALLSSEMLALVSGIASLLTLLFVVALCACKEKKTVKKQEDIELNIVNDEENSKRNNEDSHKRKKSNKTHQKQPSGTTSIEIEAETADNRHSNGSVANGRPKSHDRALPAIPAMSDGTKGTAATDDDEEEPDEGHYDVITRPKKAEKVTDVKQAQMAKKRGPNPYETVSHSDGTYAGIKDDDESAKLSFAGNSSSANNKTSHPEVDIGMIDPTYSGIQEEQSPTKGVGTHPYAVVNGVGDAQYAHIDDLTVAKKQVRRSLRQQGHGAESMETLDGSYASVPPPPVPDKNFDAASENGDLTSPPNGQLSSSPSLPPRNSLAAANGGGGGLGNSLDTSCSSDGGGNISDSVAGVGNGSTIVGINGASVVTIGDADATGAASPADIAAIKEARYSKVTARESLDNLKKRQAAEAKHRKMAPVLEAVDLEPPDSTYASVTYDEIKSPGAAGGVSSLLVGDRGSLSSDLYAEISSGQNSSRSSMYAQVGDVQANGFSEQAPAPPPLDLLKQLPLGPPKSRDNEEEMPDPGYSVIKRPRPQSVHSTAANQNLAAAAVPSGRRSPVYAVVNKEQKTQNRQTVHMSLNVDHEVNRPASPGLENLYSEVNKPAKVNAGAAGGNQTGVGARPKLWRDPSSAQGVTVVSVHQSQSKPGTHRNNEPGYQTIGSVGEQRAEVLDTGSDDPTYDNIKPDPNYDRIKDVADGGSEYDPNYESVTNLTASITGSASGARSPTEPGVAREIAPSSAAQGNVAPRWPAKREHIYQDIDEAKGSVSNGKPSNSKGAQGSTEL